MNSIISNKLFGIVLSLLTFCIGSHLQKKYKFALFNPLLISIGLCIIVLTLFSIPLEKYNLGGDIISMFLSPATAVLAYSIYHQIDLLKKYLLPMIAGCLVGALTSIGSIFFLCHLFGLDERLTSSLLPKSVTTPIAIEISQQLGGMPSITVAAVVITGILGAILTPIFLKLLPIKNKVATGVAIGSCSHAVGTSKAVQLGEIEGAMSGVAIGISGIMTVLLSLFL